MRIIIVQAEIEEAIRNYIQKQIKIESGMRIDMELAATRGEAGFTAEINIVPDVSDQPENLGIATKIAEAKAEPIEEKPAVVRKPRRTNAQIAADNAALAAQEAGEQAAEEVEQHEAVDEADVIEEALEEAQEAQPEAEPETVNDVAEEAVDVEEEAPAPAPVRKSLFGGLATTNG